MKKLIFIYRFLLKIYINTSKAPFTTICMHLQSQHEYLYQPPSLSNRKPSFFPPITSLWTQTRDTVHRWPWPPHLDTKAPQRGPATCHYYPPAKKFPRSSPHTKCRTSTLSTPTLTLCRLARCSFRNFSTFQLCQTVRTAANMHMPRNNFQLKVYF